MLCLASLALGIAIGAAAIGLPSLAAGHPGPHDWTRDDDILLEFTPGEGF